MRIRFNDVIIVIILIVVVAVIFAYPYMTFKTLEIVNTRFWLSKSSTILNPVFYLSMEIKNPNPYPVALTVTSMTISFDDGVSISLQPVYIPVEFNPNGINTTLYVGSISLGQILQLNLSPPSSYTVTWQATYVTPLLGSRTITCVATVFIQTNKITYTCTG